MKIGFQCNQSFGSKNLYSAQIQKKNIFGLNSNVDVFISELEKSDIQNFENSETLLDKTKLGGQILINFKNENKEENSQIGKKKRYFVIELPNSKFEEKFLGIGLAEFVDGSIYISKLQSMRSEPKWDNYKGIGSCLIYAITKLAQNNSQNSVSLKSEPKAIPFYYKTGFYPITLFSYNFTIHKSRFDEVCEPIQKRFSIHSLE